MVLRITFFGKIVKKKIDRATKFSGIRSKKLIIVIITTIIPQTKCVLAGFFLNLVKYSEDVQESEERL